MLDVPSLNDPKISTAAEQMFHHPGLVGGYKSFPEPLVALQEQTTDY